MAARWFRPRKSSKRRKTPTLAQKASGIGVALAIMTGLLDGSLMTAFSAFRQMENSTGAETALVYLQHFALALPMVAVPAVYLSWRLRNGPASACAPWGKTQSGSEVPAPGGSAPAAQAPGRAELRRRRLDFDVVWTGFVSGGLWASGNVLSVYASYGLGQAIGFPLTQVCVLVAALIGVLIFGEMREETNNVPSDSTTSSAGFRRMSTSLQVFAAASVIMLAGAVLLGWR